MQHEDAIVTIRTGKEDVYHTNLYCYKKSNLSCLKKGHHFSTASRQFHRRLATFPNSWMQSNLTAVKYTRRLVAVAAITKRRSRDNDVLMPLLLIE